MSASKSIAVPVTRKRTATKSVAQPSSPIDIPADIYAAPVRHRAPVAEVIAAKHRFGIGDRVHLGGGGNVLKRTASVCQIIMLMPHESGPMMYRVRSESESYERVVAETDLSALE